VCEMLASIFKNTKYKVGKFISPHLITFNDGIYINNVQITDKEVEEILIPLSNIVEEYNNTHEIPVKWFEVITSIALIYFEKNDCDFAILETGLGGTTDCTNIVNSMISIITNIGYDHIDILGDSIENIAKHKAGIIKENSDTIYIKQTQEIDLVIQNVCKEKNVNLHMLAESDVENYNLIQEMHKFDYKNYKNVKVNLKGIKQTSNAIEVLECINILNKKGYKVSDEAVKQGLKTVIHRARLETLSDNPLIIFDGGHNESAINNFMESMEMYYKNHKKVYIISILKTKDYKTVVKKLCIDKEAIFIFTDGNDKNRYVAKEVLYNEAKGYLYKDDIYKLEILDAIEYAKNKYCDRAIFIVGSFYVYKTVIEKIKNK